MVRRLAVRMAGFPNIINMRIQLLVENAVVHGIEGKEEGGAEQGFCTGFVIPLNRSY